MVALPHKRAHLEPISGNDVKRVHRVGWQYANHQSPHRLKYRLYRNEVEISLHYQDRYQAPQQYHEFPLSQALDHWLLPKYLRFFRVKVGSLDIHDLAPVWPIRPQSHLLPRIIRFFLNFVMHNRLIYPVEQDHSLIFYVQLFWLHSDDVVQN